MHDKNLDKQNRTNNMSFVFYVLFINLIIAVIFSVIYYSMKTDDNFNGLDSSSTFVDCLYFSLTTASSVGYGDISPKSQSAKILVMIQQLCVVINLSHIAINWGTVETLEYHIGEEIERDVNKYLSTYYPQIQPTLPPISYPVQQVVQPPVQNHI